MSTKQSNLNKNDEGLRLVLREARSPYAPKAAAACVHWGAQAATGDYNEPRKFLCLEHSSNVK